MQDSTRFAAAGKARTGSTPTRGIPVRSRSATAWGCERETLSGEADPPRHRARPTMKTSDQYHKWVEWSDEDQVYVGKCPDLITGIHGDDPVQLYAELCQVVEEVVGHFESSGRTLPAPMTRPMQEVA